MRRAIYFVNARDCERPGTLPSACRRVPAWSSLCDPCKRRNARGFAAACLNWAMAEREALGNALGRIAVTNGAERARLASIDQFRRGEAFNRAGAACWRRKSDAVLP